MIQFLLPRGPEPWPPWPPREDLPFDVQAGQVARLVVHSGGLDASTSPAWGCKCRPPYLLLVCLFCSVLFSNVGSVDGTQGLLLVQQALYQLRSNP